MIKHVRKGVRNREAGLKSLFFCKVLVSFLCCKAFSRQPGPTDKTTNMSVNFSKRALLSFSSHKGSFLQLLVR